MEKSFKYLEGFVHYEVTGQGKPVLLLHGFGEDRSIWKKQVEFLQKHCQLIIPDLPGTGKSTFLTGDNIALEDLADCMYALLQHEGITTATILGHSMGGYISLALAAKFPSIIHSFGLIHSTAFADGEEKKKIRLQSIEIIREYGSYSFLKNTIPNLFSDNFRNKKNETVMELVEAAKSFNSDSLIQYSSAMMNRPDRTDVLKQLTVPVLFVVGDQDIAAPLEDLKKQFSLPRQPVIHVLENVGHMGMLEATDQTNKIMLEFINR